MPLNHSSESAELTDAQCAALGRVIVEWSNIEYLLSMLLSRLLRTPDFLGRAYAQGLSAVKVQSAITEAVALHRKRYRHRFVKEVTLAGIEAANTKVSALRAERNKISHFCWCRSNDDEVFGTGFPGGVLNPKTEHRAYRLLSLAKLRAMHKEAFSLVEELMALSSAVPEVEEVPKTRRASEA